MDKEIIELFEKLIDPRISATREHDIELEKLEKKLLVELESEPRDLEIRGCLANIYITLDKLDESIKMFDSMIEIDNTNLDGYEGAGRIRLLKADDIFKQASISADLENYYILTQKAENLYMEAVPFLEKYYSKEPSSKYKTLLKNVYFKLRNVNSEFLKKFNQLNS